MSSMILTNCIYRAKDNFHSVIVFFVFLAGGQWRQLPVIVPCIHSGEVFVVLLASEEHIFTIVGSIALREK